MSGILSKPHVPEIPQVLPTPAIPTALPVYDPKAITKAMMRSYKRRVAWDGQQGRRETILGGRLGGPTKFVGE